VEAIGEPHAPADFTPIPTGYEAAELVWTWWEKKIPAPDWNRIPVFQIIKFASIELTTACDLVFLLVVLLINFQLTEMHRPAMF
jgi:hypothetical protein